MFSQGTDPEDVIKNAFGCFDENNQGYINEEYLRELLVSMGDRFTDEDVGGLRHSIEILGASRRLSSCEAERFINWR